MTGQAKRVSADDGVLFTMRGNVKLAGYVEKELRRDLGVAKQERNIPLAGSVEEQAKVTGHDLGPVPSSDAPAAASRFRPNLLRRRRRCARRAQATAQGEPTPNQATPNQSQVGEVSVGQAADRYGASGSAELSTDNRCGGDAGGRVDHERVNDGLRTSPPCPR